MCGISVLLDPAVSPRLIPRLLAMHSVILHRGPDGEGFLLCDGQGNVTHATRPDTLDATTNAPHVGFAFRRLKICDLSHAADQPMGSADGKTWIVFNGEIYNFRELRSELEAKGHVFRSHGDTEVILAAFEEWGEDCFARLDGMWAIVILDLRRNRLVVSRDRFGIKPLYWTIDDSGALLLASEIKQILAAEGRAVRSNRPLIGAFLRGYRYPVLEETFFEGVRSIPPASWCEIDLAAPAAPRFRPYWALEKFTAERNRLSYREAVERVDEVLGHAVVSHCQGDVKVGALLSGGLDSSTLVGLARRHGAPKLPTYSLGYREAAPQFCEMPYVDAMTRRDGIENHETTIDASWVACNTDRILWALEEPPLAMPAFAQYRIFEFCAEHGATVILDGQGADEVTAGYSYHQRLFVKDRLLHGQPLSAYSELRAIAKREGRSAANLFYEQFVAPRFRTRPSFPWIADDGEHAGSAEAAFARQDAGRDHSLVNRQLYFDVRWGNVKIVLGYGDRNAMAHSIESRVPYFDRAFVELLFSLPDDFKIGSGDRKRALRDVARRYVPSEITERADRMGFGTPDEEMIRGPLSEVIAQAMKDPAFRAAGWIVPEETDRFVLDFQEGHHQDFRAVWRLFVLSRWARRFSVEQ
jgi:asparagine synthase (glutamine-hydrolysing)